MGKKEKRRKYCEMCHNRTINGTMYCCKKCEEDHYAYIEISIPSGWIFKTLGAMKCKDRLSAIKDFALRHKVDLKYTVRKIRDRYNIEICEE